jgi:WD40 repeat protein
MDGAPVAAIPHQQTIRGAAFSPDGKRLAVTSGNASVALWDVSQQSPAQVWSMDVSAGGLALVGEVEISPDGLTVAVVAGYGTVVFLDAATGERVSAVDDESGGGDEVRFSPGGTLLVGVSHGSVTVVPTFDRGNMALACAMLSVQPDADALAPPECASVGATDLLQKLFLLPAHSPELARSLPF